jgi:hypothetical protein
MAGKVVFGRAGENLIDSASSVVVTAGTPLAGYPVSNLSRKTWAVPFKVSEMSAEVRWHYSGSVLPEFAVLGNSNLNVAAVLEGNSVDVWTAPNVSVPFGTPTLRADGFYTSPKLDLRTYTAQAHWRLVVTGNTLAIVIGALMLGDTYREYEGYLLETAEHLTQPNTAGDETPYGVEHIYQQGPSRERKGAELIVSADEVDELVDWFRANGGRAGMFFMATDDAIDDAMQVRVDVAGIQRKPLGGGDFKVVIPVREVSRGLHW